MFFVGAQSCCARERIARDIATEFPRKLRLHALRKSRPPPIRIVAGAASLRPYESPQRPAPNRRATFFPDPGLIPPWIDHHDGMTQNFVHRKPCSESEIDAALRVMEPPDWIALYSYPGDDEAEFIGCFHLGGHPSVMEVLRATCQACERDGMQLVLIPTEDPKVVEILDCENGCPPGYRLDELESIWREFEYARDMAREQMRLPRFSSRYLTYLKPVTPIFRSV